MPDPPLHEGIANLEAFNLMLLNQIPQLMQAADELAEHGHKLEIAQHELRAELAAATTSLDALDSEIATCAGAVESESESLGATAPDVDSALTAVDAGVREIAANVVNELAARVATIDHYIGELQEQGFSPLHQMMNALARDALGNWAATAEGSLGTLDQHVDAFKASFPEKWQALSDDGAWAIMHHDEVSWMSVEMVTASLNTVPTTVTDAPLATRLEDLYASLQREAHTSLEALRALLDDLTTQVGQQVSQRTLALIDTTGTVLEACELAEQGTGEAQQEASGAVPRAAAVAELAERIQTAERELMHIQNVLQAMDTP
jgi:hypothetical protein